MDEAIDKYKKLLLLLRQKGRDVSPPQRKALIGTILSLERSIVSVLLSRMLTGGLDLNLAKFPPRIRRLLQIALNRRLHIIHTLERIRKEQMQKKEERKKELERISFAHLKEQEREGLGNLTNAFSLFAKENNEKKNKILKKLQGQQLGM